MEEKHTPSSEIQEALDVLRGGEMDSALLWEVGLKAFDALELENYGSVADSFLAVYWRGLVAGFNSIGLGIFYTPDTNCVTLRTMEAA